MAVAPLRTLAVFRWQFALAALASLVLSAWGAYAVAIPNPDSVLYLRAADHFADGRFADAIAIYKWPFYSLLIAAAKVVTGLDALLAAQLVNALLCLGTVMLLIALASELTRGDRTVVTMAAILVILHPQLSELRPWIIKDHGYLMFLVAAVLLAVRDARQPAWTTRLLLAGSLLGATLFRIEGLYLALLVGGYYVLAHMRTVTAQATAVVLFVILASVTLPFAFRLWVTGTIRKWLAGEWVAFDLSIFSSVIERKVTLIETQILQFGAGLGWHAYASMVLGLAFLQTIRAVSPVYAVYGLFAFLPNRLIPRNAVLPVVWFAAGQIPMLFLFAFLNAMLDWRYAMGVAVIALFTTVFCLSASWRELLVGRPRAFFVFPSAVIAVGTAFAIDLPRPSPLHPLREAGAWVSENVPDGARVWTNETRIAYFAGLRYRNTGGVTRLLGLPPAPFEKDNAYDVLIVSETGGPVIPRVPLTGLARLAQFGSETESVVIYGVCRALVGCPQPKP